MKNWGKKKAPWFSPRNKRRTKAIHKWRMRGRVILESGDSGAREMGDSDREAVWQMTNTGRWSVFLSGRLYHLNRVYSLLRVSSRNALLRACGWVEGNKIFSNEIGTFGSRWINLNLTISFPLSLYNVFRTVLRIILDPPMSSLCSLILERIPYPHILNWW